MATSPNSSQGITVTLNSVSLGRLTNHQITKGHVPLDDTDYSHERENNQAGITTISGSIDCLGDPQVEAGAKGALVFGGTVTSNYGAVIVQDVTAGAQVKGQRTTRYSLASTVVAT